MIGRLYLTNTSLGRTTTPQTPAGDRHCQLVIRTNRQSVTVGEVEVHIGVDEREK